METTGVIYGSYRGYIGDNGKENGNYNLGCRGGLTLFFGP